MGEIHNIISGAQTRESSEASILARSGRDPLKMYPVEMDHDSSDEGAPWMGNNPFRTRNQESTCSSLNPPVAGVTDPRDEIILHQQDQIDQLQQQMGRLQVTLDTLMSRLPLASSPVMPSHQPTQPPKKTSSPSSTAKKNHQKIDSETSSSEEESSSRRQRSSRRSAKSAVDELAAAISRRDFREAPAPEPFNIRSGKSFNRFINRFESYCFAKFSTGTYEQWTAELGKFLKEDMKRMFQVFGGADLDYSVMKAKLQKHIGDATDSITSRRKDKFLNAVKQSDEELYIFALRLEQLYLSAYPGQDASQSHELKTRFMSSIPADDKKELQRELYLMKAISKDATGINWANLITLLRTRYDYEGHDTSYASVVSKSPETYSPPETAKVWFSSTGATPKRNPQPPSSTPNFSSSGASYDRKNYPAPPTSRPPSRLFSGSSPNVTRPIVCSWCSIPGHRYRDCRRRMNLCLRCGAEDHYLIACPVSPRNSPRPDRRTQPFRSQSPHSSRTNPENEEGLLT